MLELLRAELPGPAAGVFTGRGGGTSTGPWASANLAAHVGDRPEHVAANRRRLAAAAGLPPDRLVHAQQVHGRGVAVVDDAPSGPLPEVDALVTRRPGLGLVVLAADCLPVLLADPAAGVVAAAHAGRAGLMAGVLQETLIAMCRLGAEPARVHAVLGPAVCGRCYELPADLADAVDRAAPGSRSTTYAGTAGADVRAGAEGLLRAAGVRAVHHVGGCTVEQPERLFSYRRDGTTGRLAGLVWLDAGDR